jgi:peptide deformylase
MPVRPVLLVPDARLKERCAEVEAFDESFRRALEDLSDTMEVSPGCVGIAAPQIGEMIRVAIVDTSGHKKYGNVSQGRMVLVNPRVVRTEGERMGREGCLSLPDFTANVRRAMEVEVEYLDENGQARSVTSEDFEAVVIQHEIDHLDGLLFLDRVANLQTDVFPRKVRK